MIQLQLILYHCTNDVSTKVLLIVSVCYLCVCYITIFVFQDKRNWLANISSVLNIHMKSCTDKRYRSTEMLLVSRVPRL